jgi:glycosyltransferase involved in cell wall biosynthesis
MRVLIVTGIFPPDTGGPANYVPAFAQALSAEHEVLGVVTLSDDPDQDDSQYAFPVHRLPRGMNRVARRFKTVATILRLLKTADVVYLNGLVLEGVIASRLLSHRPVVVKVVGDRIWEEARNKSATDLDIDAFQKPGGKSASWKLMRWLQSTYTRAADFVITPSQYLSDVVAGWNVPRDRIRVVLNAVNPPPPESRPAPDHDVVTVARLVPWKGIDRLIDVCAAGGWSLLVVGDGPQREALGARAEQAGARVEFTGTVARPDVPGQIRRARVFVLNSTYEGLPHIVLEAKLAGRPVVATAVGGTPETIHDGIDGYLVPVGDDARLGLVLKPLIEDAALNAKIAQAGLADAEARFSFTAMYRQTVAVLQDAVARHG